jgi:multidrug resistance efflux pump
LVTHLGWFSRREDLEQKLDQLKSALHSSERELKGVREQLVAARVSGAKVRARARQLRLEQRRLRELLERNGISWAHEGGST